MFFRYLLRRLLALISMATVVIMMTGAIPADAESAGNHVTLSAVSCVDGQGTVTVSMTSDSTIDHATVFIIQVDDVQIGDPVSVAPGATEPKTVTNLDDGFRHIVVMAGDVYELDQSPEVQCDNVPTGPYSNPKGSVAEVCGQHLVAVNASNMPIGNNFQDLQTETFIVTVVSNLGGPVQTLDTFTLPSTGEDDAFDYYKTYALGSPGVVSLYANGVALQHLDFTDACVVVPDTVGHHPKHHGHHNNANPNVTTTLPNTGLSVRQWQAIFGFAMLLSGIVLVKVSRRPVRVRIKR